MTMVKKTEKKSLITGWSALFLALGMALTLLLGGPPESMALASGAEPGAAASFSGLVKKAKKSVVNISTVKIIKGKGGALRSPFGEGDPFHEFFDRFFRDQIPKDFRQRSLGSGFIIDREGFILTNNHVVEETEQIKVRLSNEKEYEAKIIGRDPMTDLALIRIETGEPLTPLPLGNSDALEVGDWVVAIGNPFGLDHTVTAGIVSAKYRRIGAGSYENFIQTDAPINPGNSGGPLLNTQGEVVGINSAIYSRSGGSIGIGFAIPINMAKDLLPQLKEGKVVRGWLGVMIQKVTPELMEKLKLKDEKGALVADVTSDGPAEKAGLRRGDVIVSFDGREVKEMDELPFIVAATPVGKKVLVEVMRKGEKMSFQVKVGRLGEDGETGAEIEEDSDLGMRIDEITPELARQLGLSEERGLVVVQVDPESPAGQAGITRGDIILEIDQAPVEDMEAYRKKIRRYKKGDTILLLVKRSGATLYLTLKVRG